MRQAENRLPLSFFLTIYAVSGKVTINAGVVER